MGSNAGYIYIYIYARRYATLITTICRGNLKYNSHRDMVAHFAIRQQPSHDSAAADFRINAIARYPLQVPRFAARFSPGVGEWGGWGVGGEDR